MVHGGPWVRGGYRRWQAIEQAALTAASRLAQAARIRAPVLLAFGEKDLRVPLAHGTRMRDALRAAGADPEWVTYTKDPRPESVQHEHRPRAPRRAIPRPAPVRRQRPAASPGQTLAVLWHCTSKGFGVRQLLGSCAGPHSRGAP